MAEQKMTRREHDETELAAPQGNQQDAMAIATTRAAQEVQAAMVVAKRFPRDAMIAERRILAYLADGANAGREELAKHAGGKLTLGRNAVDALVSAGLLKATGIGSKGDPRLFSLVTRSNALSSGASGRGLPPEPEEPAAPDADPASLFGDLTAYAERML